MRTRLIFASAGETIEMVPSSARAKEVQDNSTPSKRGIKILIFIILSRLKQEGTVPR
jgi:hypothetical protein